MENKQNKPPRRTKRPEPPYPRMPISERAKQFMPFSALSGLEAAIAQQEMLQQPRMELSEDQISELNHQLISLLPGQQITVTYYRQNQYRTITGVVVRIDFPYQRLLLGDAVIPFRDLASITP